MINIVIDTNVLFEGLTKENGASALLIDAWLADGLSVCISNAMALEYIDVLTRKLSAHRWQVLQPIVSRLLSQVRFVSIYYSWRPASPDPGDDHVIDCAMNANAVVVTLNTKDFQQAKNVLSLQLMSPIECIQYLNREDS